MTAKIGSRLVTAMSKQAAAATASTGIVGRCSTNFQSDQISHRFFLYTHPQLLGTLSSLAISVIEHVILGLLLLIDLDMCGPSNGCQQDIKTLGKTSWIIEIFFCKMLIATWNDANFVR